MPHISMQFRGSFVAEGEDRTALVALVRDRIDTLCIPEPNSGCFIWTGYVNTFGYGIICINKRQYRAHRAAWEVANGPISAGLVICHRCDNPGCVNPAHLFVGTQKENLDDMRRKGRRKYSRGERVWNARLTESDVRDICADARSTASIARQYGIDPKHILKIRRGSAWGHVKTDRVARPVSATPGRAGFSKLAPEQVRAIRADERSNREIAEAFGVDRSVISRVRSGRIWRHL